MTDDAMALGLADKKRADRIRKICEAVNDGDFGGENKDACTWLGSRDLIRLERWSSGDHELDWALGGGWPKGRFIELYGPEAGGKSTILLHAIAEHQKAYPDEECALIDTEFSFDEEYAIALGVQTRWLIVHQPESGEQALNVLRQLVQLGVGCIGVDSVAALTTRAELEGALGDGQVAEQARLMSKSLKVLTSEAGKRRVTVFWTNQIRDLINVSYGDKTTTPAGHALKHYASIRVNIRRISSQKEMIDGQEQFVANQVRCDIKKNKTAPPFRKAEFFISFGRGIDRSVSLFDSAVKHKVITQKGSWFIFGGENIALGRGNCIHRIQEDAELADKIAKALAATDTEEKSPVTEEPEANAKPTIKKPKGHQPKTPTPVIEPDGAVGGGEETGDEANAKVTVHDV